MLPDTFDHYNAYVINALLQAIMCYLLLINESIFP
jgi:hypothetical protein